MKFIEFFYHLAGIEIYAPLQHVRTEMCGPSPKVHRDDFEIIGRDDNKYSNTWLKRTPSKADTLLRRTKFFSPAGFLINSHKKTSLKRTV